MTRVKCVFVLAGLVLMLTAGAYASEIDVFVQKLVEKGLFTEREAREVLSENQQEIKKKMEEAKANEAKAEEKTEKLPDWIKNTKIKGDFRLRYQGEDKSDAPIRHRGRYRYRLGFETKANEKLEAAAGIATGGSDARSTNQTMEDGFSTPDIRLDYAYAEWNPFSWLTVKGGKIKSVEKVIFSPSDLLWDSDINPEGVSVLFRKESDKFDLFMNTGFWILDESASDPSDPYMKVIQPGVKYRFNDNAHLKLALSGYIFDNVKGALLTNGSDNSGKYNTLENGVLKYNYSSISPSFELGFGIPFKVLSYLSILGDYVYNPDPPNENKGFLAGIKFGDKEIKKFGNWQAKYMYRYLEKDAWLDIFPDSDAYSGHTDAKGHEFVFSFGLGKHTSLDIDYYYMKRIKGDGRGHLLQVDWNVKF